MYKTVWYIYDGMSKTELTWYHFGKKPKFPTWYMDEGQTYEIEVIRNFKLIRSPKIFLKCLTHFYIIK